MFQTQFDVHDQGGSGLVQKADISHEKEDKAVPPFFGQRNGTIEGRLAPFATPGRA
jgi:hypothetical protein